MLYFKTKKNRLFIEIQIDYEGPFQKIYMLITPHGDIHDHRHYTYVSEEIWKKFQKIANPQKLEDNLEDYAIYENAIHDDEEEQQYWADIEWQMEQAIHWYGHEGPVKDLKL